MKRPSHLCLQWGQSVLGTGETSEWLSNIQTYPGVIQGREPPQAHTDNQYRSWWDITCTDPYAPVICTEQQWLMQMLERHQIKGNIPEPLSFSENHWKMLINIFPKEKRKSFFNPDWSYRLTLNLCYEVFRYHPSFLKISYQVFFFLFLFLTLLSYIYRILWEVKFISPSGGFFPFLLNCYAQACYMHEEALQWSHHMPDRAQLSALTKSEMSCGFASYLL